jgi:3-methyladenine DNA glycosylase AlkD
MGAKARLPLDPVADLKHRLAQRSSRAIRGCVLAWWRDHELGDCPAVVGKRIARALIEQRPLEPKLAGIFVLHELLADHLRAADLDTFEALFAAGHLDEPTLVDAFALRVLGALLHRVRGRAEVARALAQWRTADTIWQRRAACVGFTALAPQGETALPGLGQLVLSTCATVVWSHERFDQTAVGWVLRELSRAEPARVDAFVTRYARLMSRECARLAVERLAVPRRKELLAHHQRCTTPKRRARR